jgi:hypothetical protein
MEKSKRNKRKGNLKNTGELEETENNINELSEKLEKYFGIADTPSTGEKDPNNNLQNQKLKPYVEKFDLINKIKEDNNLDELYELCVSSVNIILNIFQY